MTKQEQRDIIRRIERLLEFSNGFYKFYHKAVPGFSSPHELRIHRYTMTEISWQIEEIEELLERNKGLLGDFILGGGEICPRDNQDKAQVINTAKRFVDFIVNNP